MADDTKNDHQLKNYILGVDLGTTTVKVALIDKETHSIVKTNSRETQATTHTETSPNANEQDPQKIVGALQICLSGLQSELRARVGCVAITGQMHGVVLWKHGVSWKQRKSNSYGRFDIEVSCV